MAEGRVVRAISGFFDVYDEGVVRRCRARGVFKKQGVTVLVGDLVKYDPMGTQEGVVTSVLPRRSELVRPPIANVNQVLVVFAFATPDLNFLMLDKTIAAALIAGVQPAVVLTKADLVDAETANSICEIYRGCGLSTLAIATKLGEGVESVRALMRGSLNVFAGPSGAGKSTLANALVPGLELQMGAVSEKIGRGKQTTRHVELFKLDEDTWLADAPGFSQLQLNVQSRELKRFFPDFSEAGAACAYRGCVHIDEDGCEVKAAVASGTIHTSRYDSYVQIYAEIREREENMY
ncbi:ribosome small subunit-dependent GTPase A [Alicyclobacillus fastidiosus]|uniref:Small ribosomal subunit biogenesis GTPase RsgA n=1 Tax=Alicyclobacillus fastidiosus TaxID=392011 RepID=A0ABV5AH12_9BACL|nr:ribosome small subunit-dependent GTPase A [Alicyclobacillus fastidiosus]WEH08078.1 ribosome small subunit-dependent GTPase A [Alicyclobacillus fastidiosus]